MMISRTNNRSVWTVGEVSEEKTKELANELHVSLFLARVLVSKGIDTREKANVYLHGSYDMLGNPFDLPDMEKAVERIKRALSEKEKILIYGDYDVDGITSVSVLHKYLTFKGGIVEYYIPERVNEGYGLNTGAIDRFANDGVKLIITVDSGITAHEEIEYAKSVGLDVVITDHHECREELPSACAVVNPHRPDSIYPFCDLAGVGVVFKLVCALEGNKNINTLCTKYSDIVSLGTVADVMPIVGENRIIVKLGLKQLENTKNPGLASLIEESFSERNKAKRKNITASSIGYTLAPRINAAGRIGDVNKAVELLITDSKTKAQEIASYLCAVNRERQLIENKIFEETQRIIDSGACDDNTSVIVLTSDSWHLGVIGIVASKITERYKKPSILISTDGNVGKGSCRSVRGFNINEALGACGDLLVKYGGHELAAGLTIDTENIDEFRRRINEYASNTFDVDSVCNYIDIDFDIDLSDITIENAKDIQSLEPFGLMNPVPVFSIKECTVEEIHGIGEGKHSKLIISKNGIYVTALYFGTSPENLGFSEGDVMDFVGNMDINDFRGNLSVQLLVKDVRMCEKDRDMYEEQSQLLYDILDGNYTCPVEHIPDLKNFKASFLYLKRECNYDCFTNVDVSGAAKQISREYVTDISMLKMNIELCVFEEMNLIETNRIDENNVRVKLLRTDAKVNLDDSKLLVELRNKN